MGGERSLPAVWTAVLWALMLALWIALVDNTRPWELAAGAACALASAAVMVGVFRLAGIRLAVRGRWLARAIAAPWWVLRDSAIVLWAVVTRRPARGRLRAVRFRAAGDAPLDQGRRALAFSVGSAGPNQYVVAASGEDDVVVVHERVPSARVSAVDLVREP